MACCLQTHLRDLEAHVQQLEADLTDLTLAKDQEAARNFLLQCRLGSLVGAVDDPSDAEDDEKGRWWCVAQLH